MKKIFLSLVALVIGVMSLSAQENPMLEQLPLDNDVRVGVLDNGMTYFIRHNEKPKGQASFYIYHDVGAIQEDDDQQGLAHFLEHMAFNGTERYPDKTILNFLEKDGVRFGYNVNAYIANKYNSETVGTITTALGNYGAAAVAYQASLNA